MKKFLIPILYLFVLLLAPWVNSLLTHNWMLADPTMTFENAKSCVWAVQIFGSIITVPMIVIERI